MAPKKNRLGLRPSPVPVPVPAAPAPAPPALINTPEGVKTTVPVSVKEKAVLLRAAVRAAGPPRAQKRKAEAEAEEKEEDEEEQAEKKLDGPQRRAEGLWNEN
ncbi:hypothetical protein J7T55_002992 [Diaporthe amygdali]|uniref:uncharacterized protein n=1 Tax=Phomopsis amygdali TaxID=1214568 RepID=UPI0022FE0906|nr:uncharacterized protein J7T55_002992 [Diaporthe amygdali]KAJ0122479.1 hypothetical protein J7T55_002992 [Diaporthe amygdali]